MRNGQTNQHEKGKTMGTVKSSKFWVGVVVGVVIGPVVLGKVAPGIKAKIPS